MSSTEKPLDLEIQYTEQTLEETLVKQMQDGLEVFRAHQRRLDEHGFAGDHEVVMLGLEEMEPELTMADAERMHGYAPFVNVDRHRYVGVPASEAAPEVMRGAREHDLDDQSRMEWDDEG